MANSHQHNQLHGRQLITRCCVCERYLINTRWMSAVTRLMEERYAISHGYCPQCAEQAAREFETF